MQTGDEKPIPGRALTRLMAVAGGVVSFARARVGDGAKVAALESGLREGERLV